MVLLLITADGVVQGEGDDMLLGGGGDNDAVGCDDKIGWYRREKLVGTGERNCVSVDGTNLRSGVGGVGEE